MTADSIDDKELDFEEEEAEEGTCPECGEEMDPDATICPHCGAEFGFYCPDCDQEIPADATVCPHCGAELDEGFEDEDEDGTFLVEPGDPEAEEDRATFCGNCGEPITGDDLECPACGVDLCSDCGSPLDDDVDVCPVCGAEFAFSCPECGKDLDADDDVCPHCGFEFEEEVLDEAVEDD
jgi:predicted amidophosphoribosyltransferase